MKSKVKIVVFLFGFKIEGKKYIKIFFFFKNVVRIIKYCYEIILLFFRWLNLMLKIEV